MCENNKNIFYVYVYMDPTKPGIYRYDDLTLEYEPFYIGKGKGIRYKMHISEAKWRKKYGKRKMTHMHNKILKIETPIVLKIKENILENVAFYLEKKYIALIGRYDIGLGPLCNMSDGGDGQAGRIPWNKGLTKQEDSRILKYAINQSGKPRPKSKDYKPSINQSESSKKIIIEVNRKRKELGLGSPFKGKTFSSEIKQMIKDTWIEKRGHMIKTYYFIKDNKLIIIRGLTTYAKNNGLSYGNLNLLFNRKLLEYRGYTTIPKEELKNWADNYEIFDSYKEKMEAINIKEFI